MELQYPDWEFFMRFVDQHNVGDDMLQALGTARTTAMRKEDGTLVTVYDRRINNQLIELVKERFPNIAVLGEEASHGDPRSRVRMYVDPIDGTGDVSNGYGLATFGASIEVDGKVEIAFVYDPFGRRAWYRGKGSEHTCRRHPHRDPKLPPLELSRVASLEEARVTAFWWDKDSLEVYLSMLEKNKNTKDHGSVLLVAGLLCDGLVDAIIFPCQSLWEAPTIFSLVTGAGGTVTDLDGKPLVFTPGEQINGVLATNGLLHDEVLEFLRSFR